MSYRAFSCALPLAAFAAAAVTALTPAAWSSPADKAPRLLRGGGCVVAAEAQGCAPVSEGGSLPKGTFVAAGGGATLALADGSLVALEASAKLRPAPAFRVPIEGKSKVLTQIVDLVEGKGYVTVAPAPRAPTAVLVRMPGQRSAIVRSGTAVVDVAPGARARVGVLSGAVMASSDDEHWTKLGAGRGLAFEQSEGKAFALAAAPALAPSRTLTTSLTCAASPAEVRWEPVEGAAGYRVQVRSLADGRPVLRLATARGQHGVELPELAPGRYVAEVQAIDADGFDGALSSAARLSVIGVALPPGARVMQGNQLVLDRGQQVSLSHTEGAEASFSLAGPFAQAPRSVGLGGNRLGVVRLRHPGGPETELLLASRETQLRAQVQVGPATATWPRSPIHVTVDLAYQDGSPLDRPMPFSARVTVGREPVEVDWHRDGNRLTAEIAPRPLARPEALRVEVLDPDGVRVGNGLLELVPDGGAPPAKRVASR